MRKPIARMLAYIQQVNEATSVELEMGTGLRQPEVSIAAKQLEERDWINEQEEKKTGKGIPQIYTLKVGFKDIIAYLENEQKKVDVEAK